MRSMPVFAATTEGGETLAAATAETLLQLRSATATEPLIIRWGVSFNGATSTATPVLVELLFQTTDGTAGTAATRVPIRASSAVVAVTTAHHSFSAEPTAGALIEQLYVHPQAGLWVAEYPPGREPGLSATTTSRIGIRVTAPATVDAAAFFHWEE